MMVDWQPWAIAGLSAFSAIMGWFAREMWAAIKQLRLDLDTLRVHLAQDYVSFDRLGEIMRPISSQLDRIEAALIRKADRT
jgi:hypothetical protein